MYRDVIRYRKLLTELPFSQLVLEDIVQSTLTGNFGIITGLHEASYGANFIDVVFESGERSDGPHREYDRVWFIGRNAPLRRLVVSRARTNGWEG